jgi:hypothetical protein
MKITNRMKHVKLFEAWDENERHVWADFHGPIPTQEELDQFGLKLDTLPSGEPRADEFGYTVIGDLYGVKKYEDYVNQGAVTTGTKNQSTAWGGVYPGEKYHPNDR